MDSRDPYTQHIPYGEAMLSKDISYSWQCVIVIPPSWIPARFISRTLRSSSIRPQSKPVRREQ